MGDTTKRTLDLLAALQVGDGAGGAELASRLGVSAQTVQRDIERLRSYGYGVESGHGRRARHVWDEGWTAHRADRVHAVKPTGAHFEPRSLPGDAGDLWLDLLVWYDRGRPRREDIGAIRCEDAR